MKPRLVVQGAIGSSVRVHCPNGSCLPLSEARGLNRGPEEIFFYSRAMGCSRLSRTHKALPAQCRRTAIEAKQGLHLAIY